MLVLPSDRLSAFRARTRCDQSTRGGAAFPRTEPLGAMLDGDERRFACRAQLIRSGASRQTFANHRAESAPLRLRVAHHERSRALSAIERDARTLRVAAPHAAVQRSRLARPCESRAARCACHISPERHAKTPQMLASRRAQGAASRPRMSPGRTPRRRNGVPRSSTRRRSCRHPCTDRRRDRRGGYSP